MLFNFKRIQITLYHRKYKTFYVINIGLQDKGIVQTNMKKDTYKDLKLLEHE